MAVALGGLPTRVDRGIQLDGQTSSGHELAGVDAQDLAGYMTAGRAKEKQDHDLR